jgi:predicted enzyme related to lactoylglutathione lyase
VSGSREEVERDEYRARAMTFQRHEDPADALLRQVDAVTVPVPDLVQGLRFYRDVLGQELLWRNEELGQAGLRMPDTDTEIVLTTQQRLEPNWLVVSVPEAVRTIAEAGGQVVDGPTDIPVGRVAVVLDRFDNPLVLVDLSRWRYATASDGTVIGLS